MSSIKQELTVQFALFDLLQQRGEDADQPHNSTLVHYDSEVAGCLWQQTQVSDAPEYVGGTFVWTL